MKLREVAGDVARISNATVARDRGRMTVGDCEVIFRGRLSDGFGLRGRGNMMRRISASSVTYREQTLEALFRSWPALKELDVRKLSLRAVEDWARGFSRAYSPTRYNNTLDTLRALIRIAEDAGARTGNPAMQVGRVEVKAKRMVLPERGQFLAFVAAIREGGAWCSRDCADFVQFLAFTGARKTRPRTSLGATWTSFVIGFTCASRRAAHLVSCR